MVVVGSLRTDPAEPEPPRVTYFYRKTINAVGKVFRGRLRLTIRVPCYAWRILHKNARVPFIFHSLSLEPALWPISHRALHALTPAKL